MILPAENGHHSCKLFFLLAFPADLCYNRKSRENGGGAVNRLIEKAAILLICILAFSVSDGTAAPVAALLITASVSAVVQIFTGTWAAAVLIAVCSAFCGVFPVMFCALPLLLYDALGERKWWLAAPALTILANFGGLSERQVIIVSVGTAVALIMHFRISRLENAAEELRTLRDEITEKNMRLTEQNLRIAAAQDNEVHIATLKERNRIAREIHDNVGHMLTRSLLQTGALQIINKDEALREPLSELKNTLDGAMTSIRTSVHDLHDDSIDMKKTIEELAAAVGEKFNVTVEYDAGEHIPGDVKLCVAGVVKESVSNCAKHSDGDRLTVAFIEHPAFYRLLVEDNGHCTDDSGPGGIGLTNMQDRAAAVGGNITFSRTDNGFRVFMTIPKER